MALTPEINELLELDHDQRGAYIQTIQPNSPAEKAGILGGDEDLEIAHGTYIKAGGDIITKINERDVKAMDDIIAYLSSNTSIGDTITLHVLRDGKEMDIDLTLAARPNQAQRAANAQAQAEEMAEEESEGGKASLGVYISELSEEGIGVLVNTVMEDSAAADAGMEDGDIITSFDGVEVSTVQGLKDEIAKHLPGERVTVTIERNGESKDLRLTLGNTLAR